MIVVVDTNVFVGACLGSRSCADVLAACLRGQLGPLMSAALYAEYEDVLGRKRLWERARLSATEREELLDVFLARCSWRRIFFSWRPNLQDEGDNHLIELAIAGAASGIVTRNVRDFARAQLRFDHLRIWPPETLLEEIRR